MPSKLTLYHNPRCSKSRAALELLNSRELDVDVIEYLKNPPTSDELKSILERLNILPAQLLRTSDSAYKELDLGNNDHSDADIIEAMITHPSLIERPILTSHDSAAIGRPLDNIIELIDDL